MTGVVSHGFRSTTPFQVMHANVGTTLLSPVPSSSAGEEEEEDWAPTSKYILRALTMSPQLAAFVVPYVEVFQEQLQKLAIASAFEAPVTLLDCRNGEPLYYMQFSRVMRLMLIEISSVISSLPELQGVPGVEHRFSAESLRYATVKLMNKTGNNVNHMLHDLIEQRRLHIPYLNGYIVRRGEELGIKCILNYAIMQLVLTKRAIHQAREDDAIPAKGSNAFDGFL